MIRELSREELIRIIEKQKEALLNIHSITFLNQHIFESVGNEIIMEIKKVIRLY